MGQWGRIKTVPLHRYKGRPTNEKISIEVLANSEAIKFMIQLKI